ncbi:FMN-binding glutamate synthase family protein [Nocardioides marmotae]|uniref:FMN-binding glutamate synthase family protein n=1 Tax=Nocardioides marmotae TaxID=2663857 RepID=A0A6I3JCT3_9ACTN|nr:FMN-binding glutamate synthase family protein [Nocardioides marmotae]MCR6032272.1 FMN-binding glutamate synthase family protein [Gordonia jinghuaiqii]MBC9734847.1 FMN-binding glutamate synthase family protein [Nocardioides marmotae]MTB85948.1 FMN-binding glutamate synthase family protein [Nocardioides marmotae]MTB95920.1 FMN-binding glutamate synthase family protein [Nocardioides marmotae]QKE02739.1 FMN-binding glutamate synthase family protein [Nocardioides marmotae]
MSWTKIAAVGAAALGAVAAHDLTQRKHAILRNFPVVGHLRYTLERFGPELRQYIVTSNDEERPFSRDQRRWVYASSKGENTYVGFGTDNDIENSSGYPVVKHRTFAGPGAATAPHAEENVPLPMGKVLGGPRGRTKAFRPGSIVNISGMSFGSLSGNAVEALNRGAALAGCLQNTGEGGLSPYHRNGGELIFQIGTSYFGCRDAEGRFDLARLRDLVASAPVRALEIKLSQGAKPGLGGMLPGAKVSPQIAEIRGIPVGQDCASPSRHTAFSDTDSMLDFVELLAAETGLPVGIKSAVGDMTFWDQLVTLMSSRDRGVDFVTIDGGEGGTGAAPMVFSDSVAYPFRLGFAEVYRRFARAGLQDEVTFLGGGKLGLTENAVVALALGVDGISVGREAMLAIGCIQAQKCHADTCPTGVATQDPRLARGLDPALKSVRAATYVASLRRDLLKIAEAVGVVHPALIGPDDVDLVDGTRAATSLREAYGYEPGWGLPSPELAATIEDLVLGRLPDDPHPAVAR